MLVQCILLLVISVSRLYCDDGTTDSQTDQSKENMSSQNPIEERPSEAAQDAAQPIASDSTVSPEHALDQAPKNTLRGGRRRPRRFRTYYNDDRYRYRANNPYNPNSYYSFRGRPANPPMAQNTYYDPRYRESYNNQYYDPYKQGYYGYPGYSHPAYYSYPYQPQPAVPQPPQPPMPPTHPPTEDIPDLYYVRDSPNGQYQYKRVRVIQDGDDGRRGPRGTRWPRQPQQLQPGYAQGPQGYYGYSYDDYNRRSPPQPQSYYPQSAYPYPQSPQQPSAFQQQMQWAHQYTYPRAPGATGYRSRVKSAGIPVRPTAMYSSWRLTLAPSETCSPTEVPIAEAAPQGGLDAAVPSEQATVTSGD